jgi:hypothetical protein
MSNFRAVYYRDADGRESVREFIRALDPEARATMYHQIGRLNLLNDRVPHLPFPAQLTSLRRVAGASLPLRA